MCEIKSKVILYAFDKAGHVVYSQILDLGAYYDGEHIWDSWERIKTAGIVPLVGSLFDLNGNLSQEFENTYDQAMAVSLVLHSTSRVAMARRASERQ